MRGPTFIADAEGVAWARDVFGLPPDVRSVVLFGNEDCPRRVDAYRTAEPRFDERPAVVYFADAEGTLRRAPRFVRVLHGVHYVARGRTAPDGWKRCGTCGRAWTPAPAGRCPFEGMRGH